MFRTALLVHCCLLLGLASPSWARSVLEFGSSVENTEWSVHGSVFECVFEQTIPGYGRASFYHEAGERPRFQLEALRNLMAYSPARVSILPAPWQPSARAEDLGVVRIQNDDPTLKLDSNRTNQFIHALLEGKWPAISHNTYYDQNRYVKVHVSAVSFKDYYPQYQQCILQLLPVNFSQVSRSKVNFAVGAERISAADVKELDKIIFYMKHDPRVHTVYLDGHADNTGRRYDNRQISKNRVQDVERYFIQNGIDPEMITTRFHGDRYPISSNNTAKGRADNRRVTIRLERHENMPLPEHLLFKPTTNNIAGRFR